MSGGIGVLPVLGEGGFGDAGEAVVFQTMAKTMERLSELRDTVDADSINAERYVKELSVVTMDFTKAFGRMFEQEYLRIIARFSATRNSGGGVEVFTKVSWSTKLS